MNIINSIARTRLIRRHHSFILPLTNGSKCRGFNRLYSAVVSSSGISTSASSSRTALSTADGGIQLTKQFTHQPLRNISFSKKLYHDSACRGNYSTSRSMVTVTQTSASEKSDTPPPLINTSESSTSATAITDGEVTITSSCAARIRQLASTRPNPDAVYLRLYVDAGGCSGFQYKFLLLSEDDNGDKTNNQTSGNGNVDDDEEEEDDGTIDPEEDIIFTKDGMRVVIDQTSLDLLRGSTIDYIQEMIRSSFAVVGNPQSESACGCGSSFAVKNFESNPALD
jgi:Fe-S cluster assembly iron-binding protein IscA